MSIYRKFHRVRLNRKLYLKRKKSNNFNIHSDKKEILTIIWAIIIVAIINKMFGKDFCYFFARSIENNNSIKLINEYKNSYFILMWKLIEINFKTFVILSFLTRMRRGELIRRLLIFCDIFCMEIYILNIFRLVSKWNYSIQLLLVFIPDSLIILVMLLWLKKMNYYYDKYENSSSVRDEILNLVLINIIILAICTGISVIQICNIGIIKVL